MKFSATETMCQEMGGGWSFALVHEPDPVEMANVRRLSGYRHPRNRVGDVAKRLMGAFNDPRLLMDGAEAVGDPLSVLPTLYHLLWCGDLCLGLSAPLGDGSVIGCAAVGHGRTGTTRSSAGRGPDPVRGAEPAGGVGGQQIAGRYTVTDTEPFTYDTTAQRHN
ncbi:hypothetical protein [Streptomyces violens]|uniref:hypothetical protein n=1 Tax=Streptomyces violens TaxID=66377 RepID=UPI00068C8E4D|nr:hypothetical protein [Streptomyces violens]